MEKARDSSNIMISSNIMLKSKYQKDPWAYIPADLLPREYSDARVIHFLTPSQQEQMKKKLFYATHIIDEE